jgi:hypothetical protein
MTPRLDFSPGSKARDFLRGLGALLPRPRIKIEEVTIHDRDGKLLIKSGTVRGNLRLLPAFAGRMEVSSLSLTAPDIDIDLDGKPLSGEGAIARAIAIRCRWPPENMCG